jgi:predicted dehydrogenase
MNTRRSFLRIASSSLVFPYVAKSSWAEASPANRINHASFGGQGMAARDLRSIASHPSITVRAIAEIDPGRRQKTQAQYKDAKVYSDWREMLEKEADSLDTANVSTPDHVHASQAMAAMQKGIHIYGQKPLTHGVAESRTLTEYARKNKIVTQMGIQCHSTQEYRTAVRIVHDGMIGKLVEAHSFSDKTWGDPKPRPDRKDQIPTGLDWDQWVGPAPYHDYIKGYYHPGNWRKRLDYGGGTFGDMGCHIYDPTFKALGLTYPISLRSEGPVPNHHNWAVDAVVHYLFPKTPYSEGSQLPVTWYDGATRPPSRVTALLEGKPLPKQGSVIVGTEGVMLLPHLGMPSLYPQKKFEKVKLPVVRGSNHWHDFIDAALGKKPLPSANFDYAGPLTETILLGGIASRFKGEELKWDAAKLEFTGHSEASSFVRRKYRIGWEIEGLG